MKTDDFDYNLPEELIAQVPLKDRSSSRLMVLHKKTGEIERCTEMHCVKCLFHGKKETCYTSRLKWLNSEYVENQVISKKDRIFLEYLSVNIEYMARDMSDRLYTYIRKPYKQIDCWSSSACETEKALWMFNVDFPMIKWNDSEPWLIEDLKKLEVVEDYE